MDPHLGHQLEGVLGSASPTSAPVPANQLPQQRLHNDQWLEDPKHDQEQVIHVHGQDGGGEAQVAGCHHLRVGDV